MHDDFPDELRSKLRSYEEEPLPDLWQKIKSPSSKVSSVEHMLRDYNEEPDANTWFIIRRRLNYEAFFRWVDISGRIAAAIALFFLIWIEQTGINKNNANRRTVEINPSREELNLQSEGNVSSTSEDTIQSNALTETSIADRESRVEILSDKSSVKQQVVSSSDTSANTKEKIDKLFFDTTPSFGNRIALYSPGQVGSVDSLISKIQGDTRTSTFDKPAEETKTPKENRVKHQGIYALVMPTFGYQQVRPVADDDIFIESINKISLFSKKRIGIRAEIGYERKISRRLSATGGVFYFQRKQTIEYEYRDPSRVQVINVEGKPLSYEVKQEILSSTFEYELKNVGISAGINYNLDGKLFQQQLGAGLEIHRALASSAEIEVTSRAFMFANAYYRISYPVTPVIAFMIQPSVNYSVQLDHRLNAPFYVKPYGFGLNCGVFVKLD